MEQTFTVKITREFFDEVETFIFDDVTGMYYSNKFSRLYLIRKDKKPIEPFNMNTVIELEVTNDKSS